MTNMFAYSSEVKKNISESLPHSLPACGCTAANHLKFHVV